MELEKSFLESEALSTARERARQACGELGLPQNCDPLPHENSTQYRARMCQRLVGFTSTFHGQDITRFKDPALLKPVEDVIFDEAKQYADRRITTPNKLFMVESRDTAGRVISTPSNDSDPRAWMDIFANGATYRGKILDDGKIRR
jgi:hypothetical protein